MGRKKRKRINGMCAGMEKGQRGGGEEVRLVMAVNSLRNEWMQRINGLFGVCRVVDRFFFLDILTCPAHMGRLTGYVRIFSTLIILMYSTKISL